MAADRLTERSPQCEADLAGDYLFTDRDFISRLSAENRNVFQKLYDEIKYLCRVATAGSKEAKELEKVKKTFEELYRESKAEKNTAEGGVSSNFIGHNADGLEVYETSEEIKKLPYSERKKIFANLMATNFFGKTAKFKRNGHVYYAKFDESSLEKNIYGDKYSSPRGWKAKINVGADGNIFELVENSSYDHSKPEKGKKGAVHKNVGYWDYFVKTVQVDNVVYDVLINIRRKTEQDYVYSIRLWENKKIKASPPVGTSEMSSVNLGAQHFVNNISHSPENVKQKDDFSLSSKDTAPKKYGDYAVYGEDVMLEGEAKPTSKREFTAPTRESIAEGKKKAITGAPMRADVNPLKNEQVERKYVSLEDFSNRESSVWKNVSYEDAETKNTIMKETHDLMVKENSIVEVSEDVKNKVAEAYPDLRSIKKKERTDLLKEAMDKLKSNLRGFLSGIKNQSFEFEVNGKVLEAKLYSTGIKEVIKSITQEKANMLYSTEDIFRNARYLYSTPDYDSDTNVYRWNYFYTPVKINDDIVGVRIAIRDLAKQGESQIYHWGIKKDTSLDGVRDDSLNRKSHDVSSDVSTDIIPKTEQNVKSEEPVETTVIKTVEDRISAKENHCISTYTTVLFMLFT